MDVEGADCGHIKRGKLRAEFQEPNILSSSLVQSDPSRNIYATRRSQ